MQYQSTRDKNLKADSAQAVLNGLAPDGGLYTMPSFDEARFDYREVLDLDTFAMSGRILSKLLPELQKRGPASLKVCALLDKPERRVLPFQANYVGFTIPDAFVVGYGLDFDQHYRQLPYIGVLKPSVYE